MKANTGAPWIIAIATIVVVVVTSLSSVVHGQFWKLQEWSDRDLFIMETKASMLSGICYRKLPHKYVDNSRKFKIISYCCDGYVKDNSPAMHCNPVCSDGCDNGICTAPGVCECYPGYRNINGHCQAY